MFNCIFVFSAIAIFGSAAEARNPVRHRLLLTLVTQSNTTKELPAFNKTRIIPKPSKRPPFNYTFDNLNMTKPQSIDLTDLSPPDLPADNVISKPTFNKTSIPDIPAVIIDLSNITGLLLPVFDLFGSAVQRATPVNPSAPGSTPARPGLNDTAVQMQQQLATSIADMQALQRSLQSNPQAAAQTACDIATIIRIASGFTSPSAVYSSLVSGSGRLSGIDGGNALARVIAATNAGTTFDDSCGKLSPSYGSLASAVNSLMGPNNNTQFAQAIVSLSSYIDSTSNPAAGPRATTLVPSYLSGTSLGSLLSTIESGLKSANPLARYNATQIFNQIISSFGSNLLGGSSASTNGSILNGFSNGLLGGGNGLFGSGAAAGGTGTLLSDLEKLLGGSSSGGGVTSSTGSLGPLATAFTNGFSNALSGRRNLVVA